MKKMFVYGTAVLALSATPLVAQQPNGSGNRQGTPTSTQPATQGGSTGTQSGTRTQPTPKADASKSNADHQFVMEAAMGGMAEVELGQLASDKAASAAVKQFAQRMVSDHGRANDELKTLAQNKSITLPTDVGAKHKSTRDRLSKLSGAAFDRAYMQEMVADHRKDVSDFRKESKSGKDADVKAWAAKTLPTLEEHLKMAQEASRGAVGTSGTKPDADGDKSTGGTRGITGSPTPRPGGGNNEPSGTPVPGAGASGIGSPR